MSYSDLNYTDLKSIFQFILLIADATKRNQIQDMPKRKSSWDEKNTSTTQTNRHAKRPKLKGTVNETDEREPETADNQLHKDQSQLSLQRNLEASRQMLYIVYGNVVAILEEYEARTHEGAPLPRSNITSPDQSTKTPEEVKSIVQGQLMAFQMQSTLCPTRVKNAVNKELRKKTLIWAAVREERKLKMQDTDTFICQLYEILAKGKTFHENLYKTRNASSETIRETIPHIMQGTHDAATLDESFKNDPTKQATGPQTRIAHSDYSFNLGASRLKREMPDLRDDLDEDVEYFFRDGPDDIK